MKLTDLTTPSLLLDEDAFAHNVATMAKLLPGARLRPHVKAHKCTSVAKRQLAAGHRGFTCATLREVEGMAAAGLGEDLLLANEVLDARRLGKVQGRVTLAVDSAETIAAAVAGGVREVVIDVEVGLRRCGCDVREAGALADLARKRGLSVRGVMGYEGHAQGHADRALRERLCREAMETLLAAHKDVGGELVTGGGTGTFDLNTWATEIQAGSYVFLDTAYAQQGTPFRKALWIQATVISVAKGHAVADCGLKALGMDHGLPAIDGAEVLRCADEHVTFAPSRPVRVGERVRVWPAHVDPTVAYHSELFVVRGEDVLERWPIDLRGW